MDIVGFFCELGEAREDRLFAVKTALLKFFADKGCYFHVPSHAEEIYNEFTLNKMIGLWAGREVNILSEKPCFLEEADRNLIESILESPLINLADAKGSIIGRIYEYSIPRGEKKEKGAIYTPEDICEYMRDMIFESVTGYEKMTDPACGCGVFLEAFYDCLMAKRCFMESDELIWETHRQILGECIYGADSSPEAVALSKIILALKYPRCYISENIVCRDSLLSTPPALKGFFDYVISNPPYVGHKGIPSAYRKKIAEKYSAVFRDKSDLSYCFFALGETLLKKEGKLLFVTGRYFAQSRHAESLRSFIKERFTVNEAVDFFGLRPFKTAGVDPMIILMTKGGDKGDLIAVKYDPAKPFDLMKIRRAGVGIVLSNEELTAEGFNFLSDSPKRVAEKVISKCTMSLGEAGQFFQGVITGCDKAFVTDSYNMLNSDCINETGRKWIKSRDIRAEGVFFGDKYVLYTNSVQNAADMPATLPSLLAFKPQLIKRRECKKGSREWYELQWPRKSELFENPKIIFPYKSEGNRFLYDEQGYFFSADIYGFVLNEALRGSLELKKLTYLLNSPLYDRYFKTFAKKLGGALYEYYPNTVQKLMIPPLEVINGFENIKDAEAYFNE